MLFYINDGSENNRNIAETRRHIILRKINIKFHKVLLTV